MIKRSGKQSENLVHLKLKDKTTYNIWEARTRISSDLPSLDSKTKVKNIATEQSILLRTHIKNLFFVVMKQNAKPS